MKNNTFGSILATIIIILFGSCNSEEKSEPGKFVSKYDQLSDSFYSDTTAMSIEVFSTQGKMPGSTAQDTADVSAINYSLDVSAFTKPWQQYYIEKYITSYDDVNK